MADKDAEVLEAAQTVQLTCLQHYAATRARRVWERRPLGDAPPGLSARRAGAGG